jgi:broad specificity phosphatase PhoE
MPENRTQLILVRHGETDDNARGVFQGQGGSGLNALGRDQASRLAARLAPHRAAIAAVYASDLLRARETAEIVGRAVGREPVLDPDLREVFLGSWQGLGYKEIAERFPDEWAAWRNGVDFKRGGGESYSELGARVSASIGRIAAAHPGETAVVVSHGAAIKVFIAMVFGSGLESMRRFRVSINTAVNLVERDAEGAYHLAIWNDASHLGDPLLDSLAPRG